MAALFLLGAHHPGRLLSVQRVPPFQRHGDPGPPRSGDGVPAPTAAIIGSGLLLAIAGVTLLLGVLPRLGVAALVLFLIPVSFFMHAFWSDTNAARAWPTWSTSRRTWRCSARR